MLKHFCHTHELHPFEANEEQKLFCNGCELKLSGPAYKCPITECDFHIHTTGLDLPTMIQHISHPDHSLTLLTSAPETDYYDNGFVCNACGHASSSNIFVYHCSICHFDLHARCLDPLPPVIQHNAHPEHPLTLLTTAPDYYNGGFVCSACGGESSTDIFLYHCSICQFDLHVRCSKCPETMHREDHEHPLTLVYAYPGAKEGLVFKCDVCHRTVPENCWLYYCSCSVCDFGTHLDCVAGEVQDEAKVRKEEIREMQMYIHVMNAANRSLANFVKHM